jgi:hypothetical protein
MQDRGIRRNFGTIDGGNVSDGFEGGRELSFRNQRAPEHQLAEAHDFSLLFRDDFRQLTG